MPKKQPGGDFHPIGPNATADGRARLSLRREPRDGALHGSTERTLCYEVLCSVKPHSTEHPSVLPQGKGAETDRKMEKRKRVESKNIRREKHIKNERNTVMLC